MKKELIKIIITETDEKQGETESSQLFELVNEIERLRQVLNKQICEENNLSDKEIYETSEKLDNLIARYIDLKEKNK